ncbi:PREDICTED: uncharacterized protein LOC101296545 [Fragaria vesca subsp. vesca]|uniref:uncharacterized protein LOC101296545 n=1 Tax=Fragaria vesca subsp. vesca TaxID=101020 RepID=UPI0002C35F6B|nr:PREDICTED: uncharacterized protein LOC101296545 [Fragaria vesca subsp. vesca]
MSRDKVVLLPQLVLVAIEVLLVSSQTVAREGCQDQCGSVSIPYPFGTKGGCYYNDDFLITCDDTHYDPPKPFLRVSDIEVTNISIDGKLYITQKKAMACFYESSKPSEYNFSPYLSLKKFYISDTDNKFIGVGCATYAEIQGFNRGRYQYTGGCISKCESMDFVSNYSCSGIGCCQTPIAKGMTYFDISVTSYKNQTEVWDFNSCSYAFLVQEGKFNFTSDMLRDLWNTSRFPVVLDWSIGNENCSMIQKNECKVNSKCVDVQNGLGYRCKCNEGYEGNPYLNGCTDINECENPVIAKNCKQRCINKEGNYTCACHKGYHNNGTEDSVDCVADQTFVVQITLGLGVGLIALLIGSSWLYLVYKRWKLMKLKEKFFIQNGGLMLKQQLSERQGGDQRAKIFTEVQLKKATNHFSEARIVGKGGFGTVYKGIIVDEKGKETVVAIKKSKLVDRSQIQQFINEVLVLSQINHRNVVKLLGCCFETEVPLLVYEFVNNGTLFDYIHNKSKACNFAWESRLRIAAETAGVLSHLHSEASIPIIHRDVKSTNILLDDNLTAKVSDFGASRLVPSDQAQLSTMVQGTVGYLDPEYLQTSQLTDKSDVYSFGVVLVELLTGKKALSFDKPEEERNLAMYFLSALKHDRLVQVIDGCILNEANIEQLKEVSVLAKRCLRVKGEERPTMKEVAMELEGLRRMVMHHPWVNNDETDVQEIEHLLGEIAMETFSHGEVADQYVKPGCQATCGNVSIPYPFGTTEACCHDQEFLVICNTTDDPPKLYLTGGTVEVTNISVDGKVGIMQFIAHDCYESSGSPTEYNSPWLHLSKFIISHTDNLFIAVGCDTYAEIRGYQGNIKKYTGGCISTCDSTVYVTNGSCSGIGCCQTSIAKGVSYFDVFVDSYLNHTDVWSFNPCSYAFIVEESKFNFSLAMLMDLKDVTVLPVVLDWSIGNQTCEEVLEGSACQENSRCDNVENGSGYQCKCKDGYQGNPYLSNGCQDIDECENPELNNCVQRCENTEGSYNCLCRKGYHGNGIEGEEGCIANRTLVVQITVGLAIGLISLLICSSWLYLGYRRWKMMKLKERFFRQNGGLLLQQQLSVRQGGATTTNQTAKIFSAEELENATNNYHETRIVGKGGYGTVYKGILSDETVVAIKKSKVVDQSQIEQFINEVLVLSQINHRNVVKLLGCCFETEVPLLVYEFVTNGTLFDYIHNKSKACIFAWETRLRIAAEAAGVLSYLHSAASVPIIHRDVKSTNILLDETLTAKVSDFGASRLVPLDQAELSTMVQGTLGYLDPEYLQTSQLTDKSDVYSFGVVLVELLTGKKALSFDKPEEERNLAMCFLSALKEDRLVQVVDESVLNGANDEQLKEVSNLAKMCLRVKGEERPTMMEVASELEGLRRMVMHHPWVNDDQYNAEENENLLGEISLQTFSHGGGGDTSSGYDTMKNHIILPVNDGR